MIETASWVNANRITLVGDRGMRIRMNLEDMGEEQRQGIYYISALTKPEILALVENDTIQLSLFAKDLVEVESQGVRYVLTHFTSSFLRFSGATVIFIAFCSNEYNNYFI